MPLAIGNSTYNFIQTILSQATGIQSRTSADFVIDEVSGDGNHFVFANVPQAHRDELGNSLMLAKEMYDPETGEWHSPTSIVWQSQGPGSQLGGIGIDFADRGKRMRVVVSNPHSMSIALQIGTVDTPE